MKTFVRKSSLFVALFIMANLFAVIKSSAQTTVFQFNYTAGTSPSIDNAVGTPSFTSSGVANITNTGCTGNGYSGDGWVTNDYYRFTVNTTGYGSLVFNYNERASNSNIGTFKVRVSTDASTWTDIRANYTAPMPGAGACAASGNLSLPAAFDNQPVVHIEIVKTNNSDNASRTYRIDDATLTACISPTAYNVTGGGGYCVGGSGVAVGLANSETGVTYQLFRNPSMAVGSPVAGSTGNAISFGNQTVAGTYTVVATRTVGGCTNNMTGSAEVSINPLPATPTITPAGPLTVCPGSTVTLNSSAASGNQWYRDNVLLVGETGTSYVANASGSYTVKVTDGNNCSSTSAATVVTVADTQDPVITTGSIASCYPTVAAAEAAALAATSATDNCPGTITYAASTTGTCSAVVTITATDANGNDATTTYNTKIDNTAPVLSAQPGNTAVECDEIPTVPTITALDACDGTVTVSFSQTTTKGTDATACSFYNYIIYRAWSAIDACGNTATHTQTITVQDSEDPTVSGDEATLADCYETEGQAETAAKAATSFSDN